VQHVEVVHEVPEHTIVEAFAIKALPVPQAKSSHVGEQQVLASLPLHAEPAHKIVTGLLFNV